MGLLRLHDTQEGRDKYTHALMHHGVDKSHLAQFVERVEADVRSGVAHVLVLGGGPMGLLAATELALLGHQVVVREARDDLSRLNILRLWPETASALAKSWGLEKIDSGIPWSQTKPTVSTTRLQVSLLKLALLAGVRVELAPNGAREFDVGTDAALYDTLVVACGHRAELLKTWRSRLSTSGDRKDALGLPWSLEKPFAVGEKANATATALVAHFECTDTNETAARYARELPHAFDWTLNDAMPFDSSDTTVRRRALERFGHAERLCCGIGPAAVAKALAVAGYQAAAGGEAPLENVIMYANKEKTKVDQRGKVTLANLQFVPPSFYFIMTLKVEMVLELVQKMAQRTAAAAGQAAATATIPTTAKEALEWAMAQIRLPGGAVSQEAFDAEVGRAAIAIADVFTAQLSTAKKLVPFSSACRLLRDVPSASSVYGEGCWRRSTDMFDFSTSRYMKAATEVVDGVGDAAREQEVGSQRRAQPLLVLHVGDALQEPFWPEGLGINRGVHNTLDACWVANKWLAARESAAEVVSLMRERQQLYQSFTMPMSGKTRCEK